MLGLGAEKFVWGRLGVNSLVGDAGGCLDLEWGIIVVVGEVSREALRVNTAFSVFDELWSR